MTKVELVSAISSKTGFTKKDITTVIDMFTEVVEETLSNGDKVNISGFGCFEVVDRAARVGRDPRTGGTMEIAATKAAKFRAGSNLKAAVKGE